MLFTAESFPITVEEVDKHELVNSLEDAIALLIDCYVGNSREGWEDSKTESEVMDSVCDFLFNFGLQPGLEAHRDNIDRFLSERDQRRKQLAELRSEETMTRLKARL